MGGPNRIGGRIRITGITCSTCNQRYVVGKTHRCPKCGKNCSTTHRCPKKPKPTNTHSTSYSGGGSSYRAAPRGCICTTGMFVRDATGPGGSVIGCGMSNCSNKHRGKPTHAFAGYGGLRRRLSDVEPLQCTQESADPMTPSERFLHHRRLACPYQDSPGLLQLTREIERANEVYQLQQGLQRN